MVALRKLYIKRYNAKKASTTLPERYQLLYHCPTTNRSFKWASLLLGFPKRRVNAGSCAVGGSGSLLLALVDRSCACSPFATLFLTLQYHASLLYWPGLIHDRTEVAQWEQGFVHGGSI